MSSASSWKNSVVTMSAAERHDEAWPLPAAVVASRTSFLKTEATSDNCFAVNMRPLLCSIYGRLVFKDAVSETDMGPRCIIMHGVADDADDKEYNKHWIPWTMKELGQRGIVSVAPSVPQPWKPNYDNYKKVFEKYDVDENTILIGHSAGCAFLVRWLGENKQKVKKLILVAPWKIAGEGDAERKAFYEYTIDKDIRKDSKVLLYLRQIMRKKTERKV